MFLNVDAGIPSSSTLVNVMLPVIWILHFLEMFCMPICICVRWLAFPQCLFRTSHHVFIYCFFKNNYPIQWKCLCLKTNTDCRGLFTLWVPYPPSRILSKYVVLLGSVQLPSIYFTSTHQLEINAENLTFVCLFVSS